MQSLAFPSYHFRLKNSENKTYIFDRIRKKFLMLTPEEWVRQHVVHFLIETKNYPTSLIQVEKEIAVHQTKKRYDVVVFRPDGSLFLIVECKAPSIPLSQEVFDQIARYNLSLNATYLMLSNGLQHVYCQLDYEAQSYAFFEELPSYSPIDSPF